MPAEKPSGNWWDAHGKPASAPASPASGGSAEWWLDHGAVVDDAGNKSGGDWWKNISPLYVLGKGVKQAYDVATDAPGARDRLAGRTDALIKGAKQGSMVGLYDEARGIEAMMPDAGPLNFVKKAGPVRLVQGVAGLGAEALGLTNDDYDLEASRVNLELNRARGEYPVAAFAGEVAGGAPLPVGKLKLAKEGLTGAKQIAAAALHNARVGGAYGGVYGYNATQGETGERLVGGLKGGAAGAVLGGGLGAGAGSISNKLQTGKLLPGSIDSAVILETVRKQAGVRPRDINALTRILRSSGYSSDDVSRGLVDVGNTLNARANAGERIPLFATALQEQFPAATNQIKEVFQQLATAPPSQGQTATRIIGALDDQYGSQRSHFDRVAQERLGTSTVADEQAALAAERAAIGETRDRAIKFASTDARGQGLQNQMRGWYDEFADDPEVAGAMRAAAREMGYSGKGMEPVRKAMDKNPALLVQKFGETSGAQIRSPRGASPVLQRARYESENFVDELSRYNRADDSYAFAPKAKGEVGPYKRQQQRFAENYTQEEVIADARGRFARARDPIRADEFIGWYESLPQGDQKLVQTVIRQDMEKMLRGGNIDDAGAYLTNLRKEGVHDVLTRVLGEDGEAISRAIRQLSEEQQALKSLDPRKGLQARTVRGRAADRARNLYTTNPIARLGDAIPFQAQAADLLLTPTTGVPWFTMAKQGSKMFRPRAKTREGAARLLTMRSEGNALAAPSAPPPTAGSGSALARPLATEPDRAPLPGALAPELRRAQAETAAMRQRADALRTEIARKEARAAMQADTQKAAAEVSEIQAQLAATEAKARAIEKGQREAAKQIAKQATQKVKAARKQGRREGQQATLAEQQRVAALADDQARLQAERQRAAEAARQQALGQERGKIEQSILDERAKETKAVRLAREAEEAPIRAARAKSAEMQAAGASPQQVAEATGLHFVRVRQTGNYIEVPPNVTPDIVESSIRNTDPDRWPAFLQQIYVENAPGNTMAKARANWAGKMEAAQAAEKAAKKQARSKTNRDLRQAAAGFAGTLAALGAGGYGLHRMNEHNYAQAEKEEAALWRKKARERRKFEKEQGWRDDLPNIDVRHYERFLSREMPRRKIEIDGVVDRSLRNAIKAYQKKKGLAETGYLNRPTIIAMNVDMESSPLGPDVPIPPVPSRKPERRMMGQRP